MTKKKPAKKRRKPKALWIVQEIGVVQHFVSLAFDDKTNADKYADAKTKTMASFGLSFKVREFREVIE